MRRWWAISTALIATTAVALSGCRGAGASVVASEKDDEMTMAVEATANLLRGSGTRAAFVARGLSLQVARAFERAARRIPSPISRAASSAVRGVRRVDARLRWRAE